MNQYSLGLSLISDQNFEVHSPSKHIVYNKMIFWKSKHFENTCAIFLMFFFLNIKTTFYDMYFTFQMSGIKRRRPVWRWRTVGPLPHQTMKVIYLHSSVCTPWKPFMLQAILSFPPIFLIIHIPKFQEDAS